MNRRASPTGSAFCFFFFQAEDGIRDLTVTGVQTCALPISMSTLLVLVSPSPPDTSAPHDRQNLLLPGIGVWQRKHSTTGLVIGAFCPDGAESPPRDARDAPRRRDDRQGGAPGQRPGDSSRRYRG